MTKPKSFRPWNPEQTLFFPPSPVEWLPENHLVFFLLDLAAELDLEEIHSYYRQKDSRGEKAYDPRMMVVLLLYAYGVGLPSSRKIEKACWEDAAFRVLTGNQQPDHSRISDFRRRHLDAQEDGQHGKGKRGDELPKELQRRSSWLEWIRKAKAELEAEAAAAKAHQR